MEKNIAKIELEMDMGVMLFPERGACVAYDTTYDLQSKDFSISDLFKEEIENMGDLEGYMGDEEIDPSWIKDTVKILEAFAKKVEEHNARVRNILDKKD